MAESLLAQRVFYIEPSAALTGSFSQNVQKSPLLEKKSDWHLGNLGISAIWQWNNNWKLHLGYHYGAYVSNKFTFKQEAQILNNQWSYITDRSPHQFGTYVSRRVLSDIAFLAISKEKNLHLLVFDVELISGLNNNNFWSTPFYQIQKTIDDSNYFSAQTQETRNFNISAVLGLRLQFKHFHHNTLVLSILYRKGLQTLQETQINYTIQQVSYTHILQNSCDMLNVQLSLPIRIYAW